MKALEIMQQQIPGEISTDTVIVLVLDNRFLCIMDSVNEAL
jgi:hypothetical protein